MHAKNVAQLLQQHNAASSSKVLHWQIKYAQIHDGRLLCNVNNLLLFWHLISLKLTNLLFRPAYISSSHLYLKQHAPKNAAVCFNFR